MNVSLDGIFNQDVPYDYDNDYISPEDPELVVKKVVWLPLLYSVLLIVGLLGNGLLLAVLAQKSRSWSISDSFVLQLGVVDILLLVTLPFYAANANQGCGFCSETFFKICGAVFKINLYCGMFLLVWVSLDHYLSSKYGSQRFRRATLAFLGWLLVWFVSIVLTVLDWIYIPLKTVSIPWKTLSASSDPGSGADWKLITRSLHLGVGFLLPLIIQIICCSNIMLQCRSTRHQRKRPVVLILSLVAVFLLCWIPYNITLFIDTVSYASKDLLKNIFKDHISSLKTAVQVTSAVGCISACLRPLLYFFLCENFRTVLFSVLKCAKAECRSSVWELGVDRKAPHDQCQSDDEMKQMTNTKQQVEPV